jgi:hypothetical protein
MSPTFFSIAIGRGVRREVVLLGLMMFAMFAGCSERDLSGVQADFTMAPDSLDIAYRSDPAKADRDYRGKIMEISGKVFSVDLNRCVIILLPQETSTPYIQSVNCSFTKSSRNAIKNVQADSRVRIRGECGRVDFLEDHPSDRWLDITSCILLPGDWSDDAWKLTKLDGGGATIYRISTNSGFLFDPSKAVQIIVDNGSSEDVTLDLPGKNSLHLASREFVVLHAEVNGFHFAVSSPNQPRREFRPKLEPNSPWLATYVFNFRGINAYRIEKRIYSSVSLIEASPDERYEVAGEEWFRIKFETVNFFFKKFPREIRETSSLPVDQATRVRISRL